MKRFIILFSLLLLCIGLVRYASEIRAWSIAPEQITDYCNQHGLRASPPPVAEQRDMEALRSIFDYTIIDGATHRVRLYVTIFGRCERHALVEGGSKGG